MLLVLVRVSPAPSLESLNSIVSENSVGDFLTQVIMKYTVR